MYDLLVLLLDLFSPETPEVTPNAGFVIVNGG